MKDCYSKLSWAIMMVIVTAVHVVSIFFDHCIVTYGVSTYLLMYNEPQYIAKFFEIMCRLLGVKHLTTTTYHSQAIGQSEHYNKTTLLRLHHYVTDHQCNWDIYIKLMTYAINTHIYWWTSTTQFSLILSRHPRCINALDDTAAVAPDTCTAPNSAALRPHLLHHVVIIHCW